MGTAVLRPEEKRVPGVKRSRYSKAELRRRIQDQKRACMDKASDLGAFLRLISLAEDLALLHQQDNEFEQAVDIYGSIAHLCERCGFYPEAIFALNALYMLLPEGDPGREDIDERIHVSASKLEGKSISEAVNAYELVIEHLTGRDDPESKRRLANIQYRTEQLENLATLTAEITQCPSNPLLWAKLADTHRFFDNSREELVAHEMAIGHAEEAFAGIQVGFQKHLVEQGLLDASLCKERICDEGERLSGAAYAQLSQRLEECRVSVKQIHPCIKEALDRLCVCAVRNGAISGQNWGEETGYVINRIVDILTKTICEQTQLPEALGRVSAIEMAARLQPDVATFLVLGAYAKSCRACMGILSHSSRRLKAVCQDRTNDANAKAPSPDEG